MDEGRKAKWRKALKFEWKKDIWWLFFLAAVIFSAWAYRHDTKGCAEVMANPCDYCGPYQRMVERNISQIDPTYREEPDFEDIELPFEKEGDENAS